ncbi:MAG: UDP-N-acetylmuramate--L-alanine ligase [Anaerolineae bacterium]|jgi:UDP-N-acetylmuramate--alanine ligase|nr:UDP-N-acetylmuramate--L-alanine ligase [Anaerolineae bacterium]MBT4310700.1 UDP-N-acetylmuramate--L-alanine ligase [Anaerolineae bacterium]MBT4457876.1 UDP-N-acetylmuramate--L-alanine ligase [Anaerolineae bacterium]MBT4842065.1 UDP-N-acetylmuramate--L-alanine ligase [Anaerolineae bacterium]MBT6060302.1 UDP-N-acetylmuramate--L-alanine ligase [Anaerolineae bacterium]
MAHAHFIGIGGSGLSAIARLLQESGYTVTGSDRDHSPFVDDLREIGITVYIGHKAEQIAGAELIIRSSAIPDKNPEVVAALQADIPVYKRSDFLGRLMEEKIAIAIAGTHGKTSTTAMMAWTLTEMAQDPSFIVGGIINGMDVNAHAGKGETFVIEADEYDRMFLGLKPTISIVTNLEHDHPDIYPTAESFREAFDDFIGLLPEDGVLIACSDDEGAAEMLREAKVETMAYGFEKVENGKWLFASNVKPNVRGGYDCTCQLSNLQTFKLSLQVPGKHNVLNALAVMSTIAYLGLSLEDAAEALGRFAGTGRRFDLLGKVNGISIYDDYAHHPTEIRATLSAARARHPESRIWTVWQPHTYSRTQLLFDEFTQAFDDADQVIVTEIYRSREPLEDFSSKQVVKAMDHPSAKFIAELEEVSNYLIKNLEENDILLVLSAGDANEINKTVLESLKI